MGTGIANITAAKRALAKASTLDEVLEIRDKAEAIRAYMRAASESLDAQNAAADIKLRAERKAGELLAEMQLHEGGRPQKTCTTMVQVSLNDLGISRNQSSRWQLAAKLPEDEYMRLVTSCNDAGKELTQVAVLRAARIYAFGELGPNETHELRPQTQNLNLLDLIAMARSAIAELAESFGEMHLPTLIGVLKDEVETLETKNHGN